MAVGVLDNGTGFIQGKEVNVGYHDLLLNPVSGNVGIGFSNAPWTTLHVNGTQTLMGDLNIGYSGQPARAIRLHDVPGSALLKLQSAGDKQWTFSVENRSSGSVIFDAAIAVGIGVSNPQSALAVNGTIKCKEVEVTLSGFPDYVFKDGYDLMSLDELEAFIETNGHLPNMPKESEVIENGMGLAEMNVKLVEKVEELTLHTIEQQKLIEKQAATLKSLQYQLDELSNKPR